MKAYLHAPELTDDVIENAFEGTNFGRTDYREFLGYSVLKKACGWHCGHTITTIMIQMGLITPKNKTLTKLGRMFLSDCYDDPLRSAIPPAASVNSPVIPEGWIPMPRKLTAENGAKAALSGDFTEHKFINCPECFGDDECESCDGSGRIKVEVTVSWSTIKAIWEKGADHFAAAPVPGVEK